MTIRRAEATWHGTLREGSGKMQAGSGSFELPFNYGTRFSDDSGTNPEEMIGAALASCFSMSLGAKLSSAGFPPQQIHTQAKVHLGKDEVGSLIQKIELRTEANAPGVDKTKFLELAEAARKTCPISRALGGVAEIILDAHLLA